jgi:dATP pyrophosphohydrolase
MMFLLLMNIALVCVTEEMLVMSSEHKEYKWVSYSEAFEMLKYDSNRTALWELKTRLQR